jgi:hypothetical protein
MFLVLSIGASILNITALSIPHFGSPGAKCSEIRKILPLGFPMQFFCACCRCLVTSVVARGAGWVKMATRAEKAFRVLQYARTQSIVPVQRRFRTKFGEHPTVKNSIKQWYEKCQRDACLCIAKRPGRHAAEGMVGNGLSVWRLPRHKVRNYT